MKKYSSNNRGFSIIELMITLVIGGTLLAYGIPAYRDFAVRQQMTNEINDWIGDMTLARTTAVKMGQRVVIQSMGGWRNGWQVYHDVDGDNIYTDAIDNLIRESNRNVSDPNSINSEIEMDAAASGGLIVFDNLGALTGPALLNGGFQMTFRHADLPESVSATVSPSGMIATNKQ